MIHWSISFGVLHLHKTCTSELAADEQSQRGCSLALGEDFALEILWPFCPQSDKLHSQLPLPQEAFWGDTRFCVKCRNPPWALIIGLSHFQLVPQLGLCFEEAFSKEVAAGFCERLRQVTGEGRGLPLPLWSDWLGGSAFFLLIDRCVPLHFVYLGLILFLCSLPRIEG